MSFWSRVASVATVSLALFGLATQSSAGLAAEVDRTAIPQPAISILLSDDAPAAQPVPAPSQPIADAAQAEPGDTVAYPTLAAAVAAQADHDGNDAAVQCLAGTIFHESKGEPLAGQLAVAEVVINRSKSGRFPASICDVVTQRGQFGFVRGGRIPAIDESSRAYRTAVAVAKVALADAWDGAAESALYFNRGRAPAAGLRKVASIGNHVFWR